MIKLIITFSLYLLLIACTANIQEVSRSMNKESFIDSMVKNHSFNEIELKTLLSQAQVKDDILQKISNPAENLAWYKYRALFLNQERINDGISFWKAHKQNLANTQRITGVPVEIIIAIIGIETQYGKHTGKYRVIDALNTLAFHYAPRSEFFSKELEQFLLLCREEKMNPLEPLGSYAGAMGIPQFMPSSFRNYAVDFDHDNKRDIWVNADDAIASVANYLAKYHWQANGLISFPATPQQIAVYKTNEANAIKNSDDILVLELDNHQKEYWQKLANFEVIKQYNHSNLYAMAVYQLNVALKKAFLAELGLPF